MAQQSKNPKTLTSGEALEAFRRVKLSGATVVYADAGDLGIGTTIEKVAITTPVGVELDNKDGTVKATASGAVTAGKDLFSAADGKVSMTPSGPIIGKALAVATADGDIIEMVVDKRRLEWEGKTFEAIAANKTLDAEDIGKVFYVTDDATTTTLPATAVLDALGPITIMNGGADGAVAVNISPAAADKIMGPDIAGTDDKDQINTKATAMRGDLMTLDGGNADGYGITEKIGTWAEEA